MRQLALAGKIVNGKAEIKMANEFVVCASCGSLQTTGHAICTQCGEKVSK